jgi:hypothetical protein
MAPSAPQPMAPSVGEPPVAPNPPIDWQRALNNVGASRSLHYGSNAERVAEEASAAGSVQRQPAEDELTRRATKAAKADCRTAHSSMGLLALPMLAYDALGDSRCRW